MLGHGVAHQLNHQQFFAPVFRHEALLSLQDLQSPCIHGQFGENGRLAVRGYDRLVGRFFHHGVVRDFLLGRDVIPAVRFVVEHIRSGSPGIRFQNSAVLPVKITAGIKSAVPGPVKAAAAMPAVIMPGIVIAPAVIIAPGIIIIPGVIIDQGIVVDPAVFISPGVIAVTVVKLTGIAPVVPGHELIRSGGHGVCRRRLFERAPSIFRQSGFGARLSQDKRQGAVAVVLGRENVHAAQRLFIQCHGFFTEIII